MLSLCAKAGKVVSGEFATEKAIKTGEAALVIIAQDASGNTTKKFANSCDFYEVPYFVYGMSDDLGHFIGKEFRKTLAVTDFGFAKSLTDKLSVLKNMEENG